jgi:hypothetical protein
MNKKGRAHLLFQKACNILHRWLEGTGWIPLPYFR